MAEPETKYAELLRTLANYASGADAYCQVSQAAADAIRSLQAELTRAKNESASRDARWTGCDKERMALRADLARVKEENRTLRRDETRNERDDLRVRVKELEAQLAALAPKAEALTMLEKWLGTAHRNAELEMRSDGEMWHCELYAGVGFCEAGRAHTLDQAIRAAVGKAGKNT